MHLLPVNRPHSDRSRSARTAAKAFLACLLTLAVATVVGGCSSEADTAAIRTPVDTAGPPGLASIGAINLEEQLGATLGAVTTFFTVTPTGQVVVGDMSAKRVLAYAPDGRFISEVGGSGGGPGEFQVPGVIEVDPLGRLFVNDIGKRNISLFTGLADSLAKEFPVNFSGLGVGYAAWGDTLILPLQASAQPLARWVLSDDSVAAIGTDPLLKPGSGSVVMSYGIPGVARLGDSVVAWRPGAAGLEIFDRSGDEKGVVRIPRSRRRGEFEDLIAAQHAAWKDDKAAMIGSMMVGIGKLPDGGLVLASLDGDGETQPTGKVRFGNVRLYLSLVSRDLGMACVDARIPIKSDVPSTLIFRGDTALVLVREVLPGDRIRTAVERFRISDDECVWHPTSKQ